MASVKFRISSGLKSIIGRDLITNDFVAIFELVKNSFDAHATKVKVVFELEKKETAAIYIIDNGKGMSDVDIRKKWLFVAYSAKKDGSEDPNKKHIYAGSKGVGRFSCDRLGRMLQLQTKPLEQRTVNSILVDWGKFEQSPKKEFKDIGVDYFPTDSFDRLGGYVSAAVKHGTVLKITELREYESWDREKLLKLKHSLQKLLDPFAGVKENRELELVCKREEEDDVVAEGPERVVNGVVSNNIFSKFFEQSTVISVALSNAEATTTLIDRGVEIYKISEMLNKAYTELSACKVSCNIAFLNRASKIMFRKLMGIAPVEYGSVFLIHNGFRVYPVGDETDDFWGVNRRKQQGYNRYLGTRDLLGCVRVGDDGSVFQEASNREGLVGSPTVDALRSFALASIKRLEAYVTRVTWLTPEDNEKLTPDLLSQAETRSRIIRLIRDMTASSKIKILSYNRDLISILNARSEAYGESLNDLREVAERTGDQELLHKVDVAEEKYQKLQKKLREEQQRAQNEQSARQAAEAAAERASQDARRNATAYKEEQKRNAILISQQSRGSEFYENFIHDIAGNLKTARMSLEDIITDFKSVYAENSEMSEALYDLMEQIENLQSLSRFAISGNFRFEADEVEGDLVQFFRVYIERIAKANIQYIDIDFRSKIQNAIAHFKPLGLGIVIDNLVGNAKTADAESIVFELTSTGRDWIVKVRDDGRGLAADVDVDRIFEKAYSRTDGSGLGLYFCQKMLKEIGGSIELSTKQDGRGLAFVIRIPKK
ncbi:MAG: ATP-binding protein [Kiritimatiellae bacterium]|nr:ATP-binding protein [Kiritimatiellia bacterium]